MVIGVIAFQGDISEHSDALDSLGVEALEVRSVVDLVKTDGLIIPGGESPVIGKFLKESGLIEAIKCRHETGDYPILGTCAGALLLSNEIINDELSIPTLGLIDISIDRNAYGRQTESFESTIEMDIDGQSHQVKCSFIRAPIIRRVGRDVQILADHKGNPVACQQGLVLVTTFHSELYSDTPFLLHKYLLSFVYTNV